MVFILIGAVKGAKALKNEYQKDKKRNQRITSLEGSPSGPGNWYGNPAPSSSSSSSPPSHNAIGCWSRDTPCETQTPSLPILPPAQSTTNPDSTTAQLVESLPRAGASDGGTNDDHVECPNEEEEQVEKPAQASVSESVRDEKQESCDISRERKSRKVPSAAPLGSFAAAFEQQGQRSGIENTVKASHRAAEEQKLESARDDRGTGEKTAVQVKSVERVSSGVGRHERAMAAMARKKGAGLSTGGAGSNCEGGNERGKAAMARKRTSVVQGSDGADAKSSGGTDRAMAAMARKRAGAASGLAGTKAHPEGSGRQVSEGGPSLAVQGKNGSFAEAMRMGPQRRDVRRGGVQRKKDVARGAEQVSREADRGNAGGPGASSRVVTSMYAQGTMKKRVDRKH